MGGRVSGAGGELAGASLAGGTSGSRIQSGGGVVDVARWSSSYSKLRRESARVASAIKARRGRTGCIAPQQRTTRHDLGVCVVQDVARWRDARVAQAAIAGAQRHDTKQGLGWSRGALVGGGRGRQRVRQVRRILEHQGGQHGPLALHRLAGLGQLVVGRDAHGSDMVASERLASRGSHTRASERASKEGTEQQDATHDYPHQLGVRDDIFARYRAAVSRVVRLAFQSARGQP